VAGPQLNFLTLACADVERMADFLRALGWDESPETTSSTSARAPTGSAASRSG